jgi:tRNA (guanine37-N1)-methyltransferase
MKSTQGSERQPKKGSKKTQKKTSKKPITFHIISLFPGAFESYLGESILKRAIEDKKISVKIYNPRDFSADKWHRVDQRPYAGGPGMVIEALPVIKAIEKAVGKKLAGASANASTKKKVKIIFFVPTGKQFDTEYAKKAAATYTDIVFVSGRYEGIDARIKEVFKMEDITVGPYVLTGGELPAMIMIDTISRQIPGVLGDIASLEENRNASPDVYTRPEVFQYKKKSYRVPKILLSGNHAEIEKWRQSRLGK